MSAPTDLWVAIISFDGEDTVQVAASREAALYWITTQISDEDWHKFYDTLDAVGREGVSRDKSSMAPLTLIEAWAGESEDGQDVWGNDVYLVRVVQQRLWVTTGP